MTEGIKLIVTDYWNGRTPGSCCCCNHSPDFGHSTYSGMLHDRQDKAHDVHELVRRIIARSGAKDGDEIEIVVRKTGERPFGDRRVILEAPHTYARQARSATATSPQDKA